MVLCLPPNSPVYGEFGDSNDDDGVASEETSM